MKVFHIINSYSRAGAEILVSQLLAAMPRDWEKHICAIGSSPDAKDSDLIHFLRLAGVNTHELKKKVGAGRLKAVIQLRKIIKEVNPDIVHTHCESPDFFGRIASIGLPVQRFRTIHNHYPWPGNPFIGHLLEKVLSPLPVTSIGCSPGMEKAFNQCAAAKRCRVTIVNGIKLLPLRDPSYEKREWLRFLKLPSETILVGTVGRVARQKGHDLLIRALPALLKKFPNVVVAVAGSVTTEPEYYKQIETMLEESQLRSAVRFVGAVEEVPSFMSACDVLVFPSRWEGLSLAILEALSSGTPTLVSSCHPHPELLTGPYAQLLFEVENVRDLERALFWILGAKSGAVPDSRSLIETEYSFERMLQGYMDCYLLKQQSN